jgi:hypothetical protein
VTSTPAGFIVAETSLIADILAVNLRFPIKWVNFFGEIRLRLDFVALFLKKVFFEVGTSDAESEGPRASIAKRVEKRL